MKSIVFIISVLILSVVVYFGISFIEADINSLKWHWVSRAVFVLSTLAISLMISNNLKNGQIK